MMFPPCERLETYRLDDRLPDASTTLKTLKISLKCLLSIKKSIDLCRHLCSNFGAVDRWKLNIIFKFAP